MSFRLGEEGYANAEIEPVPELDHENREASVTFYIDPKSRVYVRNINFNGVDQVDDEVFRREMRQMEGAYLSNTAVDRSKVRLQRLPFVEQVEVNNEPVPGSPDLVDVNYDIEYRMPGQFSGGIGYSESQKIMLNGSIVHTNFLGSGERVALQLNSGRFQKLYSISHTDPYRTMDGVRRTVSLNYRDITQFTSAASDFSTTSAGATIDYGYPISEFQSISFGATYQRSELIASTTSTQQAQDWVLNNGNTFLVDDSPFGTVYGTEFNTVELIAGWTYDSRNRALFANRGTRQQLFLAMAIPGSDVEYRRGNGGHHGRAAVQTVLRWRTPVGTWFQGVLPRPARQFRPALWR